MRRLMMIALLVSFVPSTVSCGPSWKHVKRTKGPNGIIYEDLRPGHEGECWDDDNERVACPE